MKAPNKLYVSQLIYETWQFQTPDPDDETQVEYIRKDLLLEWAEAMKILCEEHPACEHGNWNDGNANAYGKLINKLNSL